MLHHIFVNYVTEYLSPLLPLLELEVTLYLFTEIIFQYWILMDSSRKQNNNLVTFF